MGEEEGLKHFNLWWVLALKMSPLILQTTPFGLMTKILGGEFEAPNFQNYNVAANSYFLIFASFSLKSKLCKSEFPVPLSL